MAGTVLFNLVENILQNMGSRALNEIASTGGFEDQLKEFWITVSNINAFSVDFENKKEQNLLMDELAILVLKANLYAADDLFDELATKAAHKDSMDGSNKLIKEVKSFFPTSSNRSISNKIKKIRQALDDIVKDVIRYGLLVDQRLASRQRSETCCLVDEQQVVGREDDKKAILEILDQYEDQHVCVVPIVGMEGIGKTTLAQIVRDQIKWAFDLSIWVWVSDTTDTREIVVKILESATGDDRLENLGMELLVYRLSSELIGRRCLLVLDDMWIDDRETWLRLSALVSRARKGSKVIVTTRSMKVARIMGTIPTPYYLKGLSDEQSLILLTMAADGPEHESIGKDIVKKCANVPLAIKELGCLLYGKDRSEWLHMKDRSLVQVLGDENPVMDALKISYDHLKPPLKNCFAYCALFPKDYTFNRETLISLWVAQDFVIPGCKGQSLEAAGEEYFVELLEMCFFQDVTRDECGNIESCKMHSLMHDLALEVARRECRAAKRDEIDFDSGIRHLSLGYRLNSWSDFPSHLLNLKLLRTFLLPEQINDGSTFSESICNQLLSSCRSLRVLDLHDLGLESLPNSIGNLVHLRYINLSRNSIEALPNSITELQNLQRLELRSCGRLKRLPTDIEKLANLKSLDVRECWSLTQVPSGLGLLTSLRNLPFVVVDNKCWSLTCASGKLRVLENLNNLKGSLEIKIRGELKDPWYEAKEANLRSKHDLMELHLHMDGMLAEVSGIQHDEAILNGLQPHLNLKKLKISLYKSEKLPRWALNDNLRTTLPKLVEVELSDFQSCKQLPSFSQLPFLKRLRLFSFHCVEYMESLPTFPFLTEEAFFFPSLEELKLVRMYNLNRWWREAVGHDEAGSQVGLARQRQQSGKSFPNLLKLFVFWCPNLKCIPHCPRVSNLTLIRVNETLLAEMCALSDASSSTPFGSFSKKNILRSDDVEALISLPKECLSHVGALDIRDPELDNVSRLKELLKKLNSLCCLEFHGCDKLRSISGSLEHVTALEKLVFQNCKELDLSPSQDLEDCMPWRVLNNLRYLQVVSLPKLVALPNGLQCLTTLHSLHLQSILNLEALPEWISCFSSLEEMVLVGCLKLKSLPEGISKLTKLYQLRIISCPQLTNRCQRQTGEDWPKLQHIPLVFVQDGELM